MLSPGVCVSPSPYRPVAPKPQGADLPISPSPPAPLLAPQPGRPASPPPPFSHLLRPGRETCLFRWLIVKGFDLQLTPGQDFLSSNPALFKHKNTLPSFLASVILILPALTPRPASKSRLHRLRIGGGRPGLRLQDGALGPPSPLPHRAHGDSAEERWWTGRSLAPADPDPRLRGSVLRLRPGRRGARSQALGETGGGE